MNETQLQLFAPPKSNAGAKPSKRTKQEVFEDYDGFVEKFQPKKTTDDCYTPQAVYDAVLEFVGTLTDITRAEILRPFWPGADFTTAAYPDGCIVVDNPPFSILAKIIRFYCAHGIRFFLFAPSLTLFTAQGSDVTYIVADSDIIYENGAKVQTGFVTNLIEDLRVWCCPELMRAIDKAQEEPDKTKKGFVYPDNIITAATLQKITHYGVELKIRKDSCYPIKNCSGAKAAGRSLYGGGVSLIDSRSSREGSSREGSSREGSSRRH